MLFHPFIRSLAYNNIVILFFHLFIEFGFEFEFEFELVNNNRIKLN